MARHQRKLLNHIFLPSEELEVRLLRLQFSAYFCYGTEDMPVKLQFPQDHLLATKQTTIS